MSKAEVCSKYLYMSMVQNGASAQRKGLISGLIPATSSTCAMVQRALSAPSTAHRQHNSRRHKHLRHGAADRHRTSHPPNVHLKRQAGNEKGTQSSHPATTCETGEMGA